MRLFLALSLFALTSVTINACMVTHYDYDNDYRTYVPPPWAPPYDQVSEVRYYYLPDYEIYYDVWGRQFVYLEGTNWVYCPDLPPCCRDIDLYLVFVIFIHHDMHEPWHHHHWYHDNYPRHCYDRYEPIVREHRYIPEAPARHENVPRAFNENNDRVTFMQHPNEAVRGDQSTQRPVQPARPNPTQPVQPTPSQPVQPNPSTQPSRPVTPAQPYDHVAHEVPMKVISPAMPKESQGLNYGGGYKANPPQSKPAEQKPAQQKPADQKPAEKPRTSNQGRGR